MHTPHLLFFFFNDPAPTEIYTLSLHDALPISGQPKPHRGRRSRASAASCPRTPTPWPGPRGQEAAEAREDRKSTRLNSSHDQISYAVFCLKKKKKTITESRA